MKYITRSHQLSRAYLSGFGKSHIILPLAFLGALGMGLNLLGMIFYLNDRFNATGSQLGWFATSWSLAYVIGCWLVRPLFKNFLPRYLVLFSTVLLGIVNILMAFAPNIIVIYILQAVFGMAISMFWPPLTGWLSTNYEGPELNKVLSHFNFSWSSGTIVSPYISAWLSEINVLLPIYCAVAVFWAGSLLITGAVLALPGIKSEDNEITENNLMAIKNVPENKTFLRYPSWLALFSTFIIAGILAYILPSYGIKELKFSKTEIGLVLLIRSMTMTVFFILFGKWSFWHFKSWPILTAQICLIFLAIFMIYSRTVLLLMITVPLISVFTSFAYTNSQFHCTSGSADKTKMAAIHESTLIFGLLIGSLVGGYIYQYFSVTAVYLFCAGSILVCLVIQIPLFIINQRKNML